MPSTDAFALKNSGLNPFLFAEVGIELNGSALTVLSVLGRLGQDPWDEAARWSRLPQTATIDCLADSIARMPLSAQALAEARTTATRLVRLLPTLARPAHDHPPGVPGAKAKPHWLPLVIIYCALIASMFANLYVGERPAATATTPAPQDRVATRPDGPAKS